MLQTGERGAAPRHLHGRTERRHPAPLRAIRAGLRRRARVPAALHDPALRAARCRLRQDRGRAAGRRGHPRHHRRGPGAADAGAAGRQHHLWRPDPSGGRQRRHADDHGGARANCRVGPRSASRCWPSASRARKPATCRRPHRGRPARAGPGGLKPADLHAVKTHNPFVVSDIALARATGLDVMEMNNYGCSLVWGHPQAPTGLRSVIELIEELAQRGGGLGLFTGRAAGDSAMAVALRGRGRRPAMNGVLPARIALILNCWSAPPPTGPTARFWSAANAASTTAAAAAEVRGGATPATGAAAGRARGHPARQLRPGLRADAGIANGRLPARAAQSALYRARTGFHPARRPTRAADRRRGLVRPGRAAGRRARHPLARWRGGARLTIPSDETPAAAPAGDADAPALLQYTGGTTGQPKGVILSRAAIATNVFQREAVLPTRHGAETVLCAMPLFHSYGMAMGLFLAASAAATLVVLPRYRPDDVDDAVARERVTLFPGSPTIYAGLMAHARFAQTDWSSVRVCYSAPRHWPRKRCGAGRPRWARRSMKAMARPRPAPS